MTSTRTKTETPDQKKAELSLQELLLANADVKYAEANLLVQAARRINMLEREVEARQAEMEYRLSLKPL